MPQVPWRSGVGSQVWLGDVSTYTDSMAAHEIWQALGISDHMGVSQIGDHDHCVWNGSQQPEVTAYVQKFLIGGGTADTDVLKTDGDFTFDQATWAPWSIPNLTGRASSDSGVARDAAADTGVDMSVDSAS